MANETKPRVIQVVDAEGPQLRITALVGKEPVHPAAFRQEQPAGLAVRQGQGQRVDQLVGSVLIQPQLPNLLRKGLESGIFRQGRDGEQAKEKRYENGNLQALHRDIPPSFWILYNQRMRNGKYCRSSAKTAT